MSIDETLKENDKVLKYSCGNRNAITLAYYDFSALTNKATKVNVTFDFYVGDISGVSCISLADASLHNNTNGGFANSSKGATYGTNGAIFAVGSERSSSANHFALNTTKNTTCSLKTWYSADITVDVANKKVSYTIKDTNGTTKLSGTNVDFYGTANKCTQIDFWTGNTGDLAIDNLIITSYEDASAATTSYEIKYIDTNGNEIKESRKVEDVLVGEPMAIINSDKNDIYEESEGVKTKKYIYQSGTNIDAETVADAESNIVTLTFYEAAKYNYTVSNNVNDDVITGSGFELDKVYVPFFEYINKDGVLWFKGANSSTYSESFVLDTNNKSHELTYSKTTINVVYFSEAEDIEGMTVASSGNVAGRLSGQKGAYCSDAVTITTLAPGTYTLTAQVRNTTPKFTVGEDIITGTVEGAGYVTSKTSDQFVVLEESDVRVVVSGDNSNNALDWVYIQRLGDTSASLAINSYGWASYAPSMNVKVPAGAEVYYISEKNGNKAKLAQIEAGKTVKAGEGLLVKANEAVTFEASAETPETLTNLLSGTLESTPVDPSTVYVLGCKNETVGLYKFSGTEIPAGKAYLEVAAGAPMYFLFSDDEATGINSADAAANTTNGAYNLAGQKVSADFRGIVVKNGKKYLTK